MGNPKCSSCGLTNFATAQTCRRCAQPLAPQNPQQFFYPPPQATYQPPPPPLPSVWQGNPHPSSESPYPSQPPPESYYPNQQWQAPPPQWQPPQSPGYAQPWQAPPPQPGQNPQMNPAYVAGYGQTPAYPTPQTQWVGQQPALSGLGGWLVLPAIGVIIRPLIALFGIFACLAFFGAAETLIATMGLRAYQQLKPIVGFELLSNLFMMGFCIYVAIQFFRKKRIAPKLYITMLFAQVVIVTIDALLMSLFYTPIAKASEPGSESSALVISFIAAAIWTSYFTKSVRVKNTFVN